MHNKQINLGTVREEETLLVNTIRAIRWGEVEAAYRASLLFPERVDGKCCEYILKINKD